MGKYNEAKKELSEVQNKLVYQLGLNLNVDQRKEQLDHIEGSLSSINVPFITAGSLKQHGSLAHGNSSTSGENPGDIMSGYAHQASTTSLRGWQGLRGGPSDKGVMSQRRKE